VGDRRRLRLTLEYDGRDFCGWQLQPDGRSVQGVIESALAELGGEPVKVVGAGRTDAGVHAVAQVAHCDYGKGPEGAELVRALNHLLPPDVSVREVRLVAADFHARHDALAKGYTYRVLNRFAPSPLRARQTWHIRSRLAVRRMRGAAEVLVGHHDFSAFRGAHGGGPDGARTELDLDRLEVRRRGDEVRVEAAGRSFLRHMVRNLAGTLVAVGLGRLSVASVEQILASRERAQAAPTAPAQGLVLEWIRYPEPVAPEPESPALPGA